MGTVISWPKQAKLPDANLEAEVEKILGAALTFEQKAETFANTLESEIDALVDKLIGMKGYAHAEQVLDAVRKRHGLLANV